MNCASVSHVRSGGKGIHGPPLDMLALLNRAQQKDLIFSILHRESLCASECWGHRVVMTESRAAAPRKLFIVHNSHAAHTAGRAKYIMCLTEAWLDVLLRAFITRSVRRWHPSRHTPGCNEASSRIDDNPRRNTLFEMTGASGARRDMSVAHFEDKQRSVASTSVLA